MYSIELPFMNKCVLLDDVYCLLTLVLENSSIPTLQKKLPFQIEALICLKQSDVHAHLEGVVHVINWFWNKYILSRLNIVACVCNHDHTHTTVSTLSNTSALSMPLINTGKVVRCHAKSFSQGHCWKNSKDMRVNWNRLLFALCLLLSSEEIQKKDKNFKPPVFFIYWYFQKFTPDRYWFNYGWFEAVIVWVLGFFFSKMQFYCCVFIIMGIHLD